MEFDGTGKKQFVSQINVTPLVDVMLVLLIIFMVTAPMMQAGIEVNLPKADSSAINKGEEPLVVTIDRAGRVYLGGSVMALSELRQKLEAIKPSAERAVLLKADEAVPYGAVISAIAEIKKAGIDKVGMVTEPSPPFRGKR